ncbi:xanthine dehydrogenase family protein molybdopterin-binding subunit [Tunturiibacter gelidiferens]|uniref:xanthine dehydrogenase family protein molybdopterin-binding subunit n=1 Tax=Tunturiibacter gelidiferens TaxID=3069689 RepID=UPI003D9AE11F
MTPPALFQDEAPKTPQRQLRNRYDGRDKVTGKAKYSAEFPVEDVTYAYIVQSTIPKGALVSIDQTAAGKASGVLAILTPFNAPKLPVASPQPPARRHITVLQEKDIFYNGQPIAVVVARSLLEAMQAATLLKITYKSQPAQLEFKGRLAEARPPKQPGREPADSKRGDISTSLSNSAVTIDVVYTTPIQNHNPMEPHATIAWWEGEKLNVYDATQYITGDRQTLARTFGIPVDDVRVQCPFVGGGFGSKGSTWSHVVLAAMAAKVVGKPVKLALERGQMFGPVGSRPTTAQNVKLGATADGKLLAIQHDVIVHTSLMEDFLEPSAMQTRFLYNSESNVTSHRMVEMNLGVGTYQRAPGEATGTIALECAMDELAHKLNIDPVQLRLINYAEKDPSKDRPWTEKSLRQCYTDAADRFGWSKRNPQPGQLREDNNLIGYGMATATYGANRSAASAIVRILPNGRAYIGCGTQDLGTGAYTVLAQACAQGLGIDPALVDVQLGDSNLPKAPVSGGSQSTASIGPAAAAAATQAKLKLFELAVNDSQSPLHGLQAASLDTQDGKVFAKSSPNKSDTVTAILQRAGGQPIEATASAEPGEDRTAYTSQSFGAVFAEVAVDIDTHMVQVRRIVATYDIGTLVNQKTGINQLQGGIVWGVSSALHEEAHIDPTHGRTVNETLAEYHVPVNADIGTIDVTVTGIPDTKFNPLGARGIGEIGITGAAAAIGNAIYNATGKRIRDYPITLDKIMQA